LDNAIEDNFKASLKEHKNLDDQSIDYKAKNGTLVLIGSVKTQAQKKEAASLAKHLPNVQQVVNEIEVKSDKHSTSNSYERGMGSCDFPIPHLFSLDGRRLARGLRRTELRKAQPMRGPRRPPEACNGKGTR
jgi:BON domain